MSQAARWLLCLVVLLAAVPATASAATYTVDSTADLPDRNTGDGVCKDITDPEANAKCTLRAAIMQANANPGADTIAFDIGAGHVAIRRVLAAAGDRRHRRHQRHLPAGLGRRAAGRARGATAPADTDGLRITGGSGSTVRGLIINGFRIGLGHRRAGR